MQRETKGIAMARYSMETTVTGSFEAVKARVVAAMKAQGFGVLTEIDVQQTLREKLGTEVEAYQILGACNPQLAYRALTADRSIGLLLPCNVVLREVGPNIQVSILDPEAMFAVVDPASRAALATLPQEARARLQAALATVREG